MGKWEKKTVGEINKYRGKSVNPLSTPNQIYELYSVPSWDNNYPELIRGSEIGSTKQVVEKDDVLLCKINPRINRVWVVEKYTVHPLIASSEWIIIRNKDIDSRYLSFYFQSPLFRNMMISEQSGIGGSLTRAQPKRVSNYQVPLPPLPIQQKIAAVLYKASALIEKRKAQIEKLDLLVKSQFIEMFGDPVTNPKGWEVKKLEECLVKIENGMSPNCETFPALSDREGVLKLSAVTYGYYQSQENKQLLSDTAFNSQIEVKDNDLLMTRKNTYDLVGMSAYVFSTRSGLMLPDLIFRLVPNKIINRIYLWQLINCGNFRDNIKRLASGTSGSMPNISKERLRSLCIPIPSSDLQNHFADFVQQVEAQKTILQLSLAKLELNYKSLMQKCFRGEVF